MDMNKPTPIIIIGVLCVIIGMLLAVVFYFYQTRPCPENDPLGLFTHCTAQPKGDPNDPAGIGTASDDDYNAYLKAINSTSSAPSTPLSSTTEAEYKRYLEVINAH